MIVSELWRFFANATLLVVEKKFPRKKNLRFNKTPVFNKSRVGEAFAQNKSTSARSLPDRGATI